MIVCCYECLTKYNIDDNIIGSKGQNVRCTLCGNIWFQKPNDNNIKLVKINSLPVIIKEKNNDIKNADPFLFHSIIFLSLTVLFIILMFIFQDNIITFSPEMKNLYSLIDIPIVDNKVPIKVKILKTDYENNNYIIVGTLYNDSNNIIQIPPLIVSFISISNSNSNIENVVKKIRHIVERVEIMPEETLQFIISIPNPPKNFSFSKISI